MTNEQIKNTLALIQRSPDHGDGWRSCSAACWHLIQDLPDTLVERKPSDAGGLVRMTQNGVAVLVFG